MRNNTISKRLSNSSSKHEDEDSNDLIKPTPETASLARPSVESTMTIVRHSFNETLPSGSQNRPQLQTNMNMNMRTLFDQTPISPTNHEKSPSEYPIFKLDLCQSRFEAPYSQRGPKETNEWQNQGTSIKNGYYKSSDCSSITAVEEPKKNKRSMKTLLKRHCGLNIPRSSLSLKTSSSSPKWLDSAGVGDDEALVDMKREKLLDAHLQHHKKGNKGRGLRDW